jgi:hypothetical protein
MITTSSACSRIDRNRTTWASDGKKGIHFGTTFIVIIILIIFAICSYLYFDYYEKNINVSEHTNNNNSVST